VARRADGSWQLRAAANAPIKCAHRPLIKLAMVGRSIGCGAQGCPAAVAAECRRMVLRGRPPALDTVLGHG